MTTAEADSHTADTDTRPPAPAISILVVDDEESMRHFLRRGLERLGYAAETVGDGDGAVTRWSEKPFDLAVVDLKMPGTDGLTVLGRIRARDPQAAVVLMTAHGTIASAVEAMKTGACDFVTKPFGIEELALRIERAIEQRATRAPHGEARPGGHTSGLIGQSPAICSLLQTIDLLRDSEATVLVTGEGGTGKGVVARAIHQRSRRAAGPFVTLHCAAMPETLVDSEMFGYEAGAFTGARQRKQGRVTMAHGGTLFLDDCGELSLAAQTKVSRFLQTRECMPLGASESVKVDVRVVAATNLDLVDAVARGTVRSDLLWALDVVRLHLPPLRDRREDIPLLAVNHLRRISEREHGGQRTLTADAMAALTAHDWPGNVRELENTVEHMAVLAGARSLLGVGDLPPEVREISAPTDNRTSYQAATEDFDRAFFSALLVRSRGNVTEAARLAGLSRGHLHRRISALGIRPESFR